MWHPLHNGVLMLSSNDYNHLLVEEGGEEAVREALEETTQDFEANFSENDVGNFAPYGQDLDITSDESTEDESDEDVSDSDASDVSED